MKTSTVSSPPPQPPLMFFLGELSGETKHAIFNPMERPITEVIEISELQHQVECLSSNHGWLLLLSRETHSLFFFNPITHQKIEFPYRNSIFNAAAFSAPPTSPDCTVYAVSMDSSNNHLSVDTLRVGNENNNKQWVRHDFNPIWRHMFGVFKYCLVYYLLFAYVIGSWYFPGIFICVLYILDTIGFIKRNKNSRIRTAVRAVCCNGDLYLVDLYGRVIIFNDKCDIWTRLYCHAFKRIWNPYLVEFNGEVYAGKRGGYGVVEKVTKLKIGYDIDFSVTSFHHTRPVSMWVDVEDLGGVSLFLGPHGSCALPVKGMENKVFVAGDGPMSKFVIYSFKNAGGGEVEKDEKFDVPTYSCKWYVPVWIERLSASSYEEEYEILEEGVLVEEK